MSPLSTAKAAGSKPGPEMLAAMQVYIDEKKELEGQDLKQCAHSAAIGKL